METGLIFIEILSKYEKEIIKIQPHAKVHYQTKKKGIIKQDFRFTVSLLNNSSKPLLIIIE